MKTNAWYLMWGKDDETGFWYLLGCFPPSMYWTYAWKDAKKTFGEKNIKTRFVFTNR